MILSPKLEEPQGFHREIGTYSGLAEATRFASCLFAQCPPLGCGQDMLIDRHEVKSGHLRHDLLSGLRVRSEA